MKQPADQQQPAPILRIAFISRFALILFALCIAGGLLLARNSEATRQRSREQSRQQRDR